MGSAEFLVRPGRVAVSSTAISVPTNSTSERAIAYRRNSSHLRQGAAGWTGCAVWVPLLHRTLSAANLTAIRSGWSTSCFWNGREPEIGRNDL